MENLTEKGTRLPRLLLPNWPCMAIGVESTCSPLLGHSSDSEYPVPRKVYCVTEHRGRTASIGQPSLRSLPHTRTTALFASHLMHGEFYFITGSREKKMREMKR